MAEDLKGRDGAEKKLRTIVVGEDKDEIMRQFDFNRLGMPVLFISVKQGEVANRFQAAKEVSWGFVPPQPEEMMGMYYAGSLVVERIVLIEGGEG